MARSDILFRDVEEGSSLGGVSILISRHDEANKIKRYLLRNKRKIGVKIVGGIVLAILCPPALIAYFGGAVAKKTIFTIAKWTQLYYAKKRLELSPGVFNKDTVNDDIFNINKGVIFDDSLFTDLVFLVKKSKLTEIFNSFSELEKTSKTLDEELVKLASGVNNCDHAIRLWESHLTYHFRYQSLRDDFKDFDDLILAVTMKLSALDHEFHELEKRLNDEILSATSYDKKEEMIYNAANDRRVFRHSYEFSRDRRDDIIKVSTFSAYDRNQNSSNLKYTGGILGSYVVAASVATASSAAKQAIMHSGSLGVSVVDIANHAASVSVGGIESAVEGLVLNPIVEAGNNYFDERTYETGMHGTVFTRPQTLRERIGILRTLAKKNTDDWATKLVHLNTCHKELVLNINSAQAGSTNDSNNQESLVLYLRWLKLRQQVHSNQIHLNELHEELIRFTIEMDAFDKIHLPLIEMMIKEFVDKDHPDAICGLTDSSQHFCYGSLKKELIRLINYEGELSFSDDPQAKREIMDIIESYEASDLSEIPIVPINSGPFSNIYREFLIRYYL